MQDELVNPPIVMCFSGHDPSGGAGIQADIEALVSQGCHPVTVLTTLTVQDTHNVQEFLPLPAEFVLRQARAVLADMPIAAFKIGMLGSAENAEAIAGLLAEYPAIPVVLDPILAAGGGTRVDSEALLGALRDKLLSQTTLVTPNSDEARRLTGKDNLDTCARVLLDLGCDSVLITGGHESTPAVINTLYLRGERPDTYSWTRLPAIYHGSGCTLAASLAGLLAHGLPISEAANEAQSYTWQSLAEGYALGQGQQIPNRFYWAAEELPPEDDETWFDEA